MSRCVKTFKIKDGYKNKNNKLMSFGTDNDQLLVKNKTIWTKIEDLNDIEFNALPVYGIRYTKNRLRTYGDKVLANFCGLKVPQDGVEYEWFTIISIDPLLVYENKYYLQVYLDNCTGKIVYKQRKG